MGNETSSSSSDSDKEDPIYVTLKNDDDHPTDAEKDLFVNLDLNQLFELSSLRMLASKVKDIIPENILHQHQSYLIRTLAERASSGERTLTLSDFADLLMNRSASRDDAIRLFQQFDSEGDGTADIEAMLEALRSLTSPSCNGEMVYVVRALQGCSLAPAFIDAFLEDKQAMAMHGTRLLNFLVRNRTSTNVMPFELLDGFTMTNSMRLSTLKYYFGKLDANVQQTDEQLLAAGEDFKAITKCVKSMEVSSNKNESYLLTDGEFSNYWQSDGSARSHFIRLFIRSSVVLKQLSIGVSSTDTSYMPQLVTVSVGNSPTLLRHVKEVRIDSNVSGDVVLLENGKKHFPVVQINIRRCHSDGCDTRVRSIKTLGYRIVKDQRISVSDASVSWMLQVLASTALTSMATSPDLRNIIIMHSKNALLHIAPLSLSSASSERPKYLSSYVLDQMDKFLTELITSPDEGLSRDALHVVLAFSLARGHLSGILKTLWYMLDKQDEDLECCSLMKRLSQVTNTFWKKTASQLLLTVSEGSQMVVPTAVGTAATTAPSAPAAPLTSRNNASPPAVPTAPPARLASTPRNNASHGNNEEDDFDFTDTDNSSSESSSSASGREPNVTNVASGEKNQLSNILTSSWNSFSPAYVSNKGIAKLDLFLQSAEYVQVTQVRIKLDKVNRAAKRGFVFVYDSLKAFDAKEHLSRFDKYGEWSTQKYNTLNAERTTHGISTGDEPVGSFTLDDDWDEVDIVLDQCNIGRYILIKFLCSEAAIAKQESIGLVGVRVYGIQRSKYMHYTSYMESTLLEHTDGVELAAEDISLHVLTFLMHFSRDQVVQRRSTQIIKQQCLDMQGLQLSQIWNLYNTAIVQSDGKLSRKVCVRRCMLLRLLHVLIPFLVDTTDNDTKSKCIELFDHLCGLVDNSATMVEQHERDLIYVAKQLILDGAALFFPDKDTRRQQLFTMMSDINHTQVNLSTSLTFQSLCQYFSNVDPSGLLNLPSTFEKEFDSSYVIIVMETLLTVSMREVNLQIEKLFNEMESDKSSELNKDNADKNSEENTEEKLSTTTPKAENETSPPNNSSNKDTDSNKVKEDLGDKGKSRGYVENSDSAQKRNSGGHAKSSDSAQKHISGAHTESSDSAQKQLVRLLSSLQTSLMSWILRHLQQIKAKNEKFDKKTTGKDEQKNDETIEESSIQRTAVQAMLVRFVSLVCDKVLEVMEKFATCDPEHVVAFMAILDSSFICTVFRQLILCISLLVEHVSSDFRIELLKILKPLTLKFVKVSTIAPQFFYKVTSSTWALEMSEETFRTWDVESNHSYCNNMNITLSFIYPGAIKFVVEFDPRCETERRYDYLEFVDSHGEKVRFDHKVGTEKWPQKVTFPRGNTLHFLFHSDSSNTEWGYKFKVTAIGRPEVPLNWIYDLQLSLSKLQGQLCGTVLDFKQVVPSSMLLSSGVENADVDVLKSELWTTLFRGGIRKPAGELQRSLSGKHVSTDDSDVLEFLLSLVEEPNDKLAAYVLSKCRLSQPQQLYIGGEEIDGAVRAVFATLLWHTQTLRDEVKATVLASENKQPTISEGIEQAYTVADTLRKYLVDRKQKQQIAEENDSSTEKINHALLCKEKALYLLKFSGLSKVNMRNEGKNKQSKQIGRRSQVLGIERGIKIDTILDKHPSFKLVLDFVRNPMWSKERVDVLLEERRTRAHCVSQVYMYAAEFLRIHNQPTALEMPCILFLRELLSHQPNFARHYAYGIDGCGLALESNVRHAYYTLVRYLLKTIRAIKRPALAKTEVMAYDFMVASTLHLLDVEWQLYDLSFLHNVQLPNFYMDLAKSSVSTRGQVPSGISKSDQLTIYENDMKWLKRCSGGNFVDWYQNINPEDTTAKKATQMFVAKYCDILNVEISCDGCSVTLAGRRYRCLDCLDVDLCATCYVGGVNPGGDHSIEHEFVHMMFICDDCQSFIVGDRFHCNSCEDFDLCLGCHEKKEYPGGHIAEHEVITYPMVKWKYTSDNHKNSALLSYIHQHVWLLNSALTLQLTSILYGNQVPDHAITMETKSGDSNDENVTEPVDQSEESIYDVDYTKLCSKLHAECLQQLMACLQHTRVAPHLEESASHEAVLARQEEEFVVHSQERIMGLLGAIIPPENKICISEDVTSDVFTSESFLKLLYTNIRALRSDDDITKLMALGLLGQLLQRSNINREVSDQAITACLEEVHTDGSDGKATISFLFTLGAQCLHRSDLQWSCSVAHLLRSLYNCPIWRNQLLTHLTDAIEQIQQNPTDDVDSNLDNSTNNSSEKKNSSPSLEVVFALFVIAGFPEVTCVSASVKYSDGSQELKDAIVLKPFPNKQQNLLVGKRDRKRRMIADENVVSAHQNEPILSDDKISVFITIIKSIAHQMIAGEPIPVRTLWILGLSLKAVLGCMHARSNGKNSTALADVFSPEFIQCVVFLATQETGFQADWLLKDLEVLSLMLYASHLEKDTDTPTKSTKNTEEPQSKDVDEETVTTDVQPIVTVPSTLTEDSSATFPFPELSQLIPFGVDKLSQTDNIEVNLEDTTGITDLMDTENDDTREIKNKHQSRKQSTKLLREALNSKQKGKNNLQTVNTAIALLYARKLLIILLADWPDNGPAITAKLIGCKEDGHVPFVLDLLSTKDSQNPFRKVVATVIDHCQKDSLLPIASTACNFMAEHFYSTVKEAFYTYYTKSLTHVKFFGASELIVMIKDLDLFYGFEDTDSMDICESSKFNNYKISLAKHNKREVTSVEGTTTLFKHHVELPATETDGKTTNLKIKGGTLYYRFSDSARNSNWSCSFKVKAIIKGHFNTGYEILRAILDMPNIVTMFPINDIWCCLLTVACKQSGDRRLKVLQLLLKICNTQFRTCADRLSIDLKVLRLLWNAYKTITKKLRADTETSVLSPTIRAFTEFFLVVEDLAMDWNMVDEYMLSIMSDTDVQTLMIQGLVNVAAVHAELGVPCTLVEAIVGPGSGTSLLQNFQRYLNPIPLD